MKQLNSTYSIFINKSIELKKNIHTHKVALHHATLKKTTKDPIAVLKQKLNKAINDKNTILREFEGEEKPLLYHYRKYKKTKHIRNKRGWKAYSTLKNLSTKIKKLSNQIGRASCRERVC